MSGGRARTILLIHPSVELYGSDRMFLESVTAVVDRGWTAVVVVPGDGPLVAHLEAVGAQVRTVRMPVLRKAFLRPQGLLRLAAQTAWRTPRMLRVLTETQPDLVYLSTLTSPWWAVLTRLRGPSLVVHVHEAEAAPRRLVRLGLAAPLLLARRVVVNSEASRAVLLRDLPQLARRSEVVVNGVAGPNQPVRPPRPALTGTVRLVLSGRLSPRKGTDVAIAALERLRRLGVDASLTLVGGTFPGYEWYAEQLRAQVEAAGLLDHVRFTGVVPDVWGALADADIVLVPSRVEPFGNAAAEAMLAERPLVATNAQGLREVVPVEDLGRLVRPEDPEALADAILAVIADWPARVAAAGRARAAAAQRFAPARYRGYLATLFRDTMAATIIDGPAPALADHSRSYAQWLATGVIAHPDPQLRRRPEVVARER